MKNKNDLNTIISILRDENLSLVEFCKIGAELFHAAITATVSVSPETVTETASESVSETAPVPTTAPVPQQKQEEQEEPEPSANSKKQYIPNMSAEDKLVDMSISINGDRYVSLIDLVDMIGCNRLTFIKRYPDLIKNAIYAKTGPHKKFIKLDEAKSVLFFDTFDELCSAEECGKRLGLGVSTIYMLAKKNKLQYLVVDNTRMYNIKQVVECRKRYEDLSLLHDGSAPGGNRVMAKLIV